MTISILTASLLALSPAAMPQAGVGPELAPLDAAPAVPVPVSTGTVQHLVKVSSDPMGLLRLQRLDLDLVSVDLAGGEATLLVTDEQMEQIRGVRLTPEVLIEDLAGYYARRLTAGASEDNAGVGYGQWLNPPYGQGSMSGYYTFAEVVSVLDQLTAAYPQFVSAKSSIGQSLQGRDLWMVKVSDNPGVDEPEPEMRIDALHHAREPMGMQTTLYFLCYLLEEYGSDPVATYLLDEREIYVVPCVNPDGYEFNRLTDPVGGGLWRKNRRNNGGSTGVDLNRNYPFQWGGSGSSGSGSSETYRGAAPASEPEVQAMVQFIDSREFETSLSVHTFSDLWLAPWGYVTQYPPDWDEIGEIGDLAVADNGYVHGPASIVLYQADGVTFDYEYGVKGTYGWTPEIGNGNDGFWPLQNRIVPLAEENLTSFARTVLAAGAWLRPEAVTVTDAGDGDGSFEPGEPVDVSAFVRNSGRGDSAAATIDLATSSPFATVTTAQSSLLVPSFTTGTGAAPLQLLLDPSTPVGEVVNFTVTITEGGRAEVLDGQLTVGVRVVAAYDFEAAGDQGWTIGSPNNATTGEWTRADPIGTAAQPENDNSPSPGTRCWFTGQGSVGGGLGENDVDGGSTALFSPLFDLDGSATATLRYVRWYSNDEGASPGADVFNVDLSDDGGVSWTSAEVVGPTGAGTTGGWIEASVDIGAYVALTDQVRVRFVASDLGSGSIVEAAVDDVRVEATDPGCPQPESYCVLSPNQWTAGAVMGATGSTDVTLNQLSLTVADANPSGFGLFFYGQGRAQVPAGNGSICIGGAFQRLPVVQTDAAGAASYALDFPSLPVVIANGETWNFQFWLRDVGGAAFNFSDGLEITFCP
ncbi:MAG: M14 family zinc carboxypeptidase, partial [Planctomycetota bacterium]|nr:M14 family zinc carboxypeptidase [Planctomycetota bacterium]